MAKLSTDEIERYSRHLLLPEIGKSGQEKLKAASVLLVGAGGLGSPAILYLAAAGVGKLFIADFDLLERSNLQRQVLYADENIGASKASLAAERARKLNPDIEVYAIEERLTADNALELMQSCDLVLDGTDNFVTRYLLNDACVLAGKTNVHAAIYRFEGQLSVFNYDGGPCYRCLFPEPPAPEAVPNCAEAGVLGVIAGIMGCLQASEAIKLILGLGEPLSGKLLVYDALLQNFEKLSIKRDPACKLCSPQGSIRSLSSFEFACKNSSSEFAGLNTAAEPGDLSSSSEFGSSNSSQKLSQVKAEVSPLELAAELRQGASILLVDVRSHEEFAQSRIEGAVHLPLAELPQRLSELSSQQEIVLYCKSGVRSARALEVLVNSGFSRVRSLSGGLISWSTVMD